MNDTITIQRPVGKPLVYKTHAYLSFGDYGGAGAYGQANVETVLSDVRVADDTLTVRYLRNVTLNDLTGYGYRIRAIKWENGGTQLYVREDVWRALELDSLDDYPALDGDRVYEIEQEWRDAYIADNARDILREIPEVELDDALRAGLLAADIAYEDDSSTLWEAISACGLDNGTAESIFYDYLRYVGDYPEFDCENSGAYMRDQAQFMERFPEYILTAVRRAAVEAGQMEFPL